MTVEVSIVRLSFAPPLGVGCWFQLRCAVVSVLPCYCAVSFVGSRPFDKALASWQWYNYMAAQIPAGRTPLRINLDETAICLYQGARMGNIFAPSGSPAVQNVSLGRRRTYMTHVAIICDAPHIQPLLPQILICNERTIPKAQLATLRAGLPNNVWLLRQRSAWSNTALMRWVVRLLGAAVAPFLADFVPIFLFDASKTHTHATVFAACRRAGLLPGLVPSKMTWLLQPLDIRGFLPFKLHLQREYQVCRIRAVGGVVAVGDWFACVCAAIRIVLQGRCWATAFDAAGFGPGQAGVSEGTKAILCVDGPICVGATRPSAEQLRSCFPKRTKVPSKAIQLAWDVAPVGLPVPPPAKAKPKPAARPPTSCVAVGYPLGPRLGPRPPPLSARALRRSARSAAPKAVCMSLARACPSVAPPPRVSSSSSSSRPPP